ncbi:hypothetical protein BGZ83_005062 [Gryganskiella cystojenkinii]|nr:hypothetical protein BGZ83_005062 [Gryganskiella cystojenkinii]
MPSAMDIDHPEEHLSSSSVGDRYSTPATTATSTSSSKQTSPAPSNRSESPSSSKNSSKGKLFQCSGFGDCRMVFTRSEHLARHARKHTGEKPFQCVVDGCTRMFSRFDNMVQHTQTHTKGAKRESSASINNKIQLETRRRSEAGLIGGSSSGVARSSSTTSSKGSKSSKKTSSGTKKNRVNSMPMIKFGGSESSSSSPSMGRSIKRPPSSSTSPLQPSPEFIRSKNHHGNTGGTREVGKIRKKSSVTNLITPSSSSFTDRRASSSSSSGGLSWYASKLHHKSSVDLGRLNNNSNNSLDAHLPPLSPHQHQHHYRQQQQYDYSRDPLSTYRRPRHPLSPERSSNSEDDAMEEDNEMEDDDDDDDEDYVEVKNEPYRPLEQSNRGDRRPHQPWGGMVDSFSMDHLTLPPLRDASENKNNMHHGSHQGQRLPSFSHESQRYRSHSLNFDHPHHPQHYQHSHHSQQQSHHRHSLYPLPGQNHGDPYSSVTAVATTAAAAAAAPKVRRLSLADLETPIQETKKVIHQAFLHGGGVNKMAVEETAMTTSSPTKLVAPPTADFEGVDVSADEIQALEAFSELWSQGRDVNQNRDVAQAH